MVLFFLTHAHMKVYRVARKSFPEIENSLAQRYYPFGIYDFQTVHQNRFPAECNISVLQKAYTKLTRVLVY